MDVFSLEWEFMGILFGQYFKMRYEYKCECIWDGDTVEDQDDIVEVVWTHLS